jgi:predicted methyltransferase
MKQNILAALTALTLLAVSASTATGQTVAHKISTAETQTLIRALVDDPERPAPHKARDIYRHPYEALTFFGLEPGMTVVEIWPGGQGRFMGRIIQPLVEGGGGWYVPVPSRSAFPGEMQDLPYGKVDMVLVFRAHAFMIYKEPAQAYINEIFRMLKPGGIFAIVDHAGDENMPQDPEGKNGYVNESHVLMLARRAGFHLLAVSDVNRNPRDSKDHPRGVWSLPPALRGHGDDAELRARYIAIGETDRFTHKYYKPLGE